MQNELPVNIDFDESSRLWRYNKKHIENGQFGYTCCYVHSNGRKCNKIIYSQKSINRYKVDFGGCESAHLIHKNADTFCKQHLNRSFR